MIDEQIRDGDFVIVERRSDAREGDTVVALLRGDEATLKTFQRRGATVRLVPANPRMKPIEAPARDVEIRGIVRALLRRY
jgi:repressor LexA